MRTAGAIISGGAVLALAACAAAQGRHDLRRKPAFRVGDTVVATGSSHERTTIADDAGKPLRIRRTSERKAWTEEVLELDDRGRPKVLRITIRELRRDYHVAAGDKTQTKTVRVSNVSVLARRTGRRFRPDMATLAGPDTDVLRASQVCLLKEALAEDDFSAWPEGDMLLMAERPVPVGATWRPSAEALTAHASSEQARRLGARIESARLRLAAVRDGVAVVTGTARSSAQVGTRRVVAPLALGCRIDVRTGRWVGTTLSMSVRADLGEVSVASTGGSGKRFDYRTGRGAPATRPGRLHSLGWPPAGKDANSYRDPAHGLSIDLPDGLRPRPEEIGGSTVAAFGDREGCSLRIAAVSAHVPLDLTDAVPAILKVVRANDRSFRLRERRRLTLPGGVPAVLLTSTLTEGKVLLYTIIAIDGPRLVSVTAGAPAGRKDTLAALRKAVRTLRVFEPEAKKE